MTVNVIIWFIGHKKTFADNAEMFCWTNIPYLIMIDRSDKDSHNDV